MEKLYLMKGRIYFTPTGEQRDEVRRDFQTKIINDFEKERVTLRHRQVLKQILKSLENYLQDLKWAKKAEAEPKRSLNPKKITTKENDLFDEVVKGKYREKLKEECSELSCVLPIEMEARGSKGQTLRSLSVA